MSDKHYDQLETREPAQRELAQFNLLPDLVREFEGIRSEGEIRACADAILADYEEVPVRSFVMTIAHRRARQCLAAETCEALATG